jgi:DNA-binding domain
VPYAYKVRANHVEAVRLVNDRVSQCCASAAKRGWGGEYVPPKREVRESGGAAGNGGRFGRDPAAKTRKLQRELLTLWKKNEKEERDERRRREKEKVEKARMEPEKKEEMRQRRKLEFLITQTELYSHFVGKGLRVSEVFHYTMNSKLTILCSIQRRNWRQPCLRVTQVQSTWTRNLMMVWAMRMTERLT